MLANNVIFNTLKHADEVGKLASMHFETGRSTNSIAKESNDLISKGLVFVVILDRGPQVY